MRFAALLAAIFSFSLSGCATAQPFINAGKACIAEADAATAKQILPDVNAALGCSIADTHAIPDCVKNGLEQLGAQWGSAALQCALQQIASAVSTSGDADAVRRQQRAKDALRCMTTTVSAGRWRNHGRALALAPPGKGPGSGGG